MTGQYTDKDDFYLRGDSDGRLIGNIRDSLKVSFASQPLLSDSFGRLRVSQPIGLFEFSHRFDLYQGMTVDTDLTGSATSTHDANRVSRLLNVTTSNGDQVIYQSRRYLQYYKGKAQQILFTGSFNAPKVNLRQRMGYFDDKNGVFFEIDGETINVVRRSNVSGSVIDYKIARASWDDPFDGTGGSEFNADFDKQQLFIIDFTWLGSGSIRFGVVVDGNIEYCHTIYAGNYINEPWSQSGNLPLRFEITNTGATASASTMYVTCGSVSSEGGIIDRGIVLSHSSVITATTVTTTPTLIAGLRMNPSYNRAACKPIEFVVTTPNGNKEVYWRLLLNPTITTPTWTNKSYGIMQYLSAYDSFSGGISLEEGYVEVGGRTILNFNENDIYFGRSINGISDILALELRTPQSTATSYFSGLWREYT